MGVAGEKGRNLRASFAIESKKCDCSEFGEMAATRIGLMQRGGHFPRSRCVGLVVNPLFPFQDRRSVRVPCIDFYHFRLKLRFVDSQPVL